MLIIGKGSIEERIRTERRKEAITRRQIDVLEGRTKAKGPQRGDFTLCREQDKTLSDYRRFKDPKDREKIKQEYFGRQKEYKKP